MNRRDLLKISLWLVIGIFFLNAMAMKFFWYYSIWWFDMPMHFLGGVFVGLASLAFWTKQPILRTILSILVISILWELFEFSLDAFITYNPHNFLDTLSDVSFDLAGGLLSILYFLYNYKHEKNLNY